jgi:hypothetical protein
VKKEEALRRRHQRRLCVSTWYNWPGAGELEGAVALDPEGA